MKTKTIKTEAELKDAILSGDSYNPDELIEATFKDGSTIVRIRIGNLIVDSLYGLQVTRRIEHEEAERYRVRVDHPHFASLNRYFESEYEGRGFERTFDAVSDATVDAKTVKVLVNSDGKVIAEVADDGTQRPLVSATDDGDEIPF